MSRRAQAAIDRPAQPSRALLRSAMLSLLAGFGTGAAGQGIALLNFTGVDGYVSTSFLDDRNATRQDRPAGGVRSRDAQSEWRNEVFVMTHGYVYHPNFVTLDIGGGPILQAGELSVDGDATRSDGLLYNLVGRANFLQGKPVSGALFYEHQNPVMSIAPGQALQQEIARYGAEVAATSAALPTPLRLELTHTESNGRSDERVMNDRSDLFNMRLTRALGSQGATQLQLLAIRQESLSGSTSLPIQSSTSESRSLDLDTRLPFGADDRHELTNLLSINRQAYAVDGRPVPEQAAMNFLVDLRLKQSEEITSFGTMQFSSNDNGERASITRSAASGITWSPSEELELALEGRTENQQAGPFSMNDRGLDAAIRHQQALPVGALQTGYRVRHGRRNQRAQAPHDNVVGERASLAGATPTTLSLPRVVAGSVVVSNLTRSQVYLEHIDYVLTTVGQTTRLQRLIGGNILDGEDVLIDYAYDLGGTFTNAQTDRTFNLSWAPSPEVNVYFREYRSTVELLSGTPTFALDDTRSRLYGVRADVPFAAAGLALTAGGSVERERVADAINPLVREAADLYLQTDEPLFDVGSIGLSLRKMTMNYGNSTQDLDLRGYGLRFSTRWLGADVSAVRNFECDRGGPTARCRLSDAINAQWRERQLTMTARLAHARETQGGFERNHTLFHVGLRRDI